MTKPQSGADSSRPYRTDMHGLPYLGPEALRAAKLRIRIQRMILSVDEHDRLAELESTEEKERFVDEIAERQRLQRNAAMTSYYPARPLVKQESYINLAYPEWADKHYHGD
ncbi:hypothetical protein [[Erwinia] mediterraneensis]|uniref:hypothetical protein n=1 Tax=[Erwinia] mediterraneensis TaxID=2161819 RepID=UPI0010324AAE|nr:hypothetical protein [[Erwinia] mediterraneensis]